MATGDDNATSVESGSTVFFDNICQPCENDGHILEAEGRCEDCDEYLCKPCFLAHTVPSKMRNHAMTGKEQLDKDGPRERKDRSTQKCSHHDGEFIKYYCPTHLFLGCSACMILNHKSCSDTIYIPEAAKDVLSSEEYCNYKAQTSAIETTSQNITTDVKQRIETFNLCQTTAVRNLRSFKKEIIDLFETAEKKLMEESENVKQTELKKQESILETNAALDYELRALTSQVESFESLKQYCNMYIALMKTKKDIQLCENRIAEIDQKQNPHREICFSPNHTIVAEILSSRGIGNIKDGITHVEHLLDVNVKTKSDTKTCWIAGSVMLPGNKLIISDRLNDKLKMIDTRLDEVVEELSMSSHPWDMTATRYNEVAVTLYENKIAFIKTDDKLVNHRNIDVNGTCRGVAYREDTLVVTFTDPSKVEVMDMQGVVLRTLATDDTIDVNLNLPLFVDINSVNNAIYISDCNRSTVVCLTSDGMLKSTYTDTQSGKLTGLGVDSFGTVYVCDWKNQTVHQITDNCKKKRILLTEKDVTQPYSICYCGADDKFYVGMRDCDIVKVFRVS